MHSSSKKVFRSSPQALIVLAALCLGLVPGCARSSDTNEVAPEAAPSVDETTAAELTSSKIQKRQHEPVASLLAGRTAGVHVSLNPDGSISVRIRGPASFLAGGEPLYILDGSPIWPGWGGALRGINPNDIESIQVLKYPPETSLYGVRGANGVIVIKTKLRP